MKKIIKSVEKYIIDPPEEAGVKRVGGELVFSLCKKAKRAALYRGCCIESIDKNTPLVEGVDTAELVLQPVNGEREYYLLKAQYEAEDIREYLLAERFLPLEGGSNFRDIGGYPLPGGNVRWGTVFRSDKLSSLTDADVRYLGQIGLKTVLDVRTSDAIERSPDKLPEPKPRWRHLSAFKKYSESIDNRWFVETRGKYAEWVRESYVHIVDDNPEYFHDYFTTLGKEENLPLLIHCTVGKDRTGVSIALLLIMLGVPEEIVIADYSLTNYAFPFLMEDIKSLIKSLEKYGFSPDELVPLFVADPAYLKYLLEHIKSKYGSVSKYIHEYVGISPALINRVRDLLIF